MRGILWIILAVIAVNIVWLVLELVTAGSVIQYLLSLTYTGQFSPSIEHIVTRTIFLIIQAIPWFLVLIFGIIVFRGFLPKPSEEGRNRSNLHGSICQTIAYKESVSRGGERSFSAVSSFSGTSLIHLFKGSGGPLNQRSD